jgi:hypothetical protein
LILCDKFIYSKRQLRNLEKTLNQDFPSIIHAFLLKNPKGKFVIPFSYKISLFFLKYFDEKFLSFLIKAIDIFLEPSTPHSISIQNAPLYKQNILLENDFSQMIQGILKSEMLIPFYSLILKLYNEFNSHLDDTLSTKLFRLIHKQFLYFVENKSLN